MTADVRTFRAPNMQAALDIVRQEMGQDAVILSTRHVEKRRLLPFLRAKEEVEVTAGLGAPARGVKAAPSIAAKAAASQAAAAVADLSPPPPLLSGRQAYGSGEASGGPSAASTPATTGHTRRNTVVPPRWSPSDIIVDLPARSEVQPPHSAPTTPSKLSARGVTIAQRASAMPVATPAPERVATRPSKTPQTNAAEPTDTLAIHERLDALQRMILELGKERARPTLSDVPTELFQLYTRLIDNEVEEELARELVCRAKVQATRVQIHSPSAMLSLVSALTEQELKIAAPIKPTPGRRKVVALIGPTGVGKTTTLAKLAANLRLREGVKVGLITVDTYRIAAVEQLKTYAELIDLPMKVVTSPQEMQTALDGLRHVDLVLIDTAGRSPRDDLKIQELKDCLDAARADEVHLVLSAAAGMSSLETVASHFKPVGVNSLILTKLDEATAAGQLLSVARHLRTPVSYLTTGQNVPDDIEPAHATRMARLILGIERIAS